MYIMQKLVELTMRNGNFDHLCRVVLEKCQVELCKQEISPDLTYLHYDNCEFYRTVAITVAKLTRHQLIG